MRKFFLIMPLVALASLVVFVSCNDDVTELKRPNEKKEYSKLEVKSAIKNTVKELYDSRYEVNDVDIITSLEKQLPGISFTTPQTRVNSNKEVAEGAKFILDKMQNACKGNFDSKEEYEYQMFRILESNKSLLTEEEYKQFEVVLFVSSEILDIYLQKKIVTKGWWASWGKCVAGILGGAGTEGLAGAAVGSVVPGLGTAAGAVVGAVSGGLTGAALAC